MKVVRLCDPGKNFRYVCVCTSSRAFWLTSALMTFEFLNKVDLHFFLKKKKTKIRTTQQTRVDYKAQIQFAV